jgi:hypothetical protein
MPSSKYTCEARILDQLRSAPVPHSTTKSCGAETSKRISVDSGDAYMSICSCCFKRFIRRSVDKSWFGWFDCDYPPEAQVVGSKWYYENVATQKVKASPTPQAEPAPVVAEEVELCQAFAGLSIEEKKQELKQKIKEIQKVAKPGKMTLKEIQAAFKEITELRTQIHML